MDTFTEATPPLTKKEKQKSTSEKIKKLMKNTKVAQNSNLGSSRRFKIRHRNRKKSRRP